MSDLANLIREKREREGLNLREAGVASGVAFSTLARIENGANPSLKVDRLIRAWLNGESPLLPTPPMTLRDWFAGRAMQAFITAHMSLDVRNYIDGDGAKAMAGEAYMLADAMLSERKQGLQP